MATMAELEGFLTKKFDLRKSGEGRYNGAWFMHNNRSQMVLLDVFDEKLVVSSPFAKVSELPLPAAHEGLPLSFVFGRGGLRRPITAFRHVIPLADIDESESRNGALNVISVCADQN